MTPGQLLTKTVLMQVILVIIKIIFFGFLNVELIPILILYYVLLAASSIALVRRFGPINYFEAFLAMGLWLILSLLTDYFITSAIVGKDVFTDIHFWISYVVVLLAIFLFHKKQHVAIRKAMKS